MPINLPFRPRRDSYPADLWTKCPSCGEMLFNKQLDKAQRVCPHCGHHFRLSARVRLELLLDAGTFRERDARLAPVDALGFVDQKSYPDRIAAAQLSTGQRDAAVWGTGAIEGRPVAICVMDFGFMGGSMGAVVGEKVTRAAEAAADERLPLIVVSASGGARMQEGTLALMQLAKTMAALERLRAARVPYLSILTDPTTGGVFASFAAMGDLNIAEPNALIGFAGARVAAGTIAEELPPGFQRSEFLFRHGFIDRVVTRAELRAELTRILDYVVPPRLALDSTAAVDGGGPLSLRRFAFLNPRTGLGSAAGGAGSNGTSGDEAESDSPGEAAPAAASGSGSGPILLSAAPPAASVPPRPANPARAVGLSRSDPSSRVTAPSVSTLGALAAPVGRTSLSLPSIPRPTRRSFGSLGSLGSVGSSATSGIGGPPMAADATQARSLGAAASPASAGAGAATVDEEPVDG